MASSTRWCPTRSLILVVLWLGLGLGEANTSINTNPTTQPNAPTQQKQRQRQGGFFFGNGNGNSDPNGSGSRSDGSPNDASDRKQTAEKGGGGGKRGKNLKQLLQELEDSDYDSYGSWGNFRMRKDPPKLQQQPNAVVVPVEQAPSAQQQNNYFWKFKYSMESEPSPGTWDNDRSPTVHTAIEVYPYMALPSKYDETELNKLDPSKLLSFTSVNKLMGVAMIGVVLSYLAVSPRTLPTPEYNLRYKENVLRLLLSTCMPLLTILMTHRSAHADINTFVHLFALSFFVGYPICFLTEVVLATFVKLAVLHALEPKAFRLCPTIPAPYLPWVLARNGYLPRRSTLFISTILNCCVMSPITEEVFKVFMFRRSGIRRGRRPTYPTTVRTYIIYMLAVSIGLKTADNLRRILLYTGPLHTQKTFFAFMRGLFPVHELCGALSAILLAKSEVLGYKVGFVRAVLPAAVLHSMANFRGMKPLYVWDSYTPWHELQLQAWTAPDDASAVELVYKGLTGLLWFTILLRVLNYIITQYVSLSREYLLNMQQQMHMQE